MSINTITVAEESQIFILELMSQGEQGTMALLKAHKYYYATKLMLDKIVANMFKNEFPIYNLNRITPFNGNCSSAGYPNKQSGINLECGLQENCKYSCIVDLKVICN